MRQLLYLRLFRCSRRLVCCYCRVECRVLRFDRFAQLSNPQFVFLSFCELVTLRLSVLQSANEVFQVSRRFIDVADNVENILAADFLIVCKSLLDAGDGGEGGVAGERSFCGL